MATNLRLRPEAEEALRERSERTGDSQQKIIRDAIDAYLGRVEESTPVPGSIADLVARGVLIAARTPLRHSVTPLALPPGMTSLDLLHRDERL
jgi:hypothetical protein